MRKVVRRGYERRNALRDKRNVRDLVKGENVTMSISRYGISGKSSRAKRKQTPKLNVSCVEKS